MVSAVKKSESKPKTSKPKAPRAAKSAASSATGESKANGTPRRREVRGVVLSDKMQKTVVVKVDRTFRHGKYRKFLVRSQRYLAHNEDNKAKVGDNVVLVETRPVSRHKRWAVKEITGRSVVNTVEADLPSVNEG